MPHPFCTLPYKQRLKKGLAGVFLLSYPLPAPTPRPAHRLHRQDAGILTQQKQGISRGLCTQTYRVESSGNLECSRAFVLSPNSGRMPATSGPERRSPSGPFFVAPAGASRCRGNPHLARGMAGSRAVVHVLDDPVALASRGVDPCGVPGRGNAAAAFMRALCWSAYGRRRKIGR